MKIHYISDVHLEFGNWPRRWPLADLDCDVHVLAGDIAIGLAGLDWSLRSFKRPVVYIAGNHEFFGQRPMKLFWEKARAKVAGTHVHLLENEAMVIEGVRFLGATLWTDFCLFGRARRIELMNHCAQRMTDYQRIYLATRRGRRQIEPRGPDRPGDRLTTTHVLNLHEASVAYLQALLAVPHDGPTVVTTHHAPHPRSLLYQEPSAKIDAAYASDLTRHGLLDRPLAPTLWIHGHTHVAADYEVGATRVVCNPRGYVGDALVEGFDPGRIVQI